jgi:peptidoglycan-associated lipoprotein
MNKNTFLSLIVLALFLGACNSANKLVKKGNKRFNRGEYAFAIEHYQQALGKGADKAMVNAQIAESYRLANNIHDAAPYYSKALQAGNNVDSVLFQHAFALKAEGKYAAAAEQLNAYIARGGNQANIARAREEVKNLKEIERIMAKETPYEVKNLDMLNTNAAEFSPLYVGNQMYFTSNRGEGKIYAATGTGFTNLYTYKFDGSEEFSGAVVAMDGRINTPNKHEASATISKDGKTMVFARGNDGRKKGDQDVNLFISYYKNGEWSEPEMMSISDPKAWDSSPAFSADGASLYFSSNREGGYGGNDIYRATKDTRGRWTKVVNMGDKINSRGNEVFPYVSDDGKLYFSSDGHPGLGGLDLFEATREKGVITVVNLGVPVNSRWDDFGISFRTPMEGFFSSNREGGKGDDDIYYFKNVKGDIKNINYILAGIAVERDDSGKENVLSQARVKLLDSDGKLLGEQVTTTDGRFNFELENARNYTLVGEKQDYFTRRDPFTTFGKSIPQEQLKADTTITLSHVLNMNKIVVDKAIVMENIYYDLDKADIRPDAAIELDKLVEILQDNPNISIELGSHTDVRGADDYNMKLSQRRAESAVNYIISRGISRDRIRAKGYGETELVIPNAQTEDEHQTNRRTEFKVINIR